MEIKVKATKVKSGGGSKKGRQHMKHLAKYAKRKMLGITEKNKARRAAKQKRLEEKKRIKKDRNKS